MENTSDVSIEVLSVIPVASSVMWLLVAAALSKLDSLDDVILVS